MMLLPSRVAHIFLGGAVALLTAATLRAQKPAASQDMPTARGFAVTSDVTMRVYVPAGRLRVTTWERDSVHVSGSTASNSSVFGGGSRTHIKLGVEARITGDSALPRADWVLQVPKAARLWIKMIDGDMDVRGTTNELELYNVRGRIDVSETGGVTSIESIDAPVSISQARNDVRVRGSRGAVTLTDVQGTLSVVTVSGGVTLHDIAAEGRVESIGGPLTVQGATLAGRVLELQSHSGAITLHVSARATPQLTLSSRTGRITGVAPGANEARAARYGQIIARSFKGDISVHTSTPLPAKR